MPTRERRVFNVVTADTAEPISFDVHVTRGDGEGSETKRIEYVAWGEAPADAMLVLTTMSRVTDRGQAMVDASGMSEFMDKALMPSSATAWREMIADPDWKIPADIIMEVVQFLQEEWTGRPTPRSSSSSTGRPTTSGNSTEPASLTA